MAKNEEGTVIAKENTYCLKFADNIALTAASAEELQSMLKNLEKFYDMNKMIADTDDTKIMVFENSGRTKRRKKWIFTSESLEVLKNYKYLGFWFS